MTWLIFFGSGPIQAQPQAPKGVSVGFANRTEMNLVVQGYSFVNKVQRAGPAMQLEKNGGKNFETNVPTNTFRYYTVYDANFKILLRNYQIPIQGRNAVFDIMPSPTDPKAVVIVPAQP
jgi:hypothetical protein